MSENKTDDKQGQHWVFDEVRNRGGYISRSQVDELEGMMAELRRQLAEYLSRALGAERKLAEAQAIANRQMNDAEAARLELAEVKHDLEFALANHSADLSATLPMTLVEAWEALPSSCREGAATGYETFDQRGRLFFTLACQFVKQAVPPYVKVSDGKT